MRLIGKMLVCIAFPCMFQVTSVNAIQIDSLQKQLQDIPQDSNRIETTLKLARAFWESSKYNEAMLMANNALLLSRKLNYNKGIAFSLLYKGMVSYAKEDYAYSLTCLSDAIPFFEQVGSKEGKALDYHWLANTHYAKSQYEKALEYYTMSFAIREEIGDKKGAAYSLNNIANVYSDQKQYEKALGFHFKSLKLKKELDDKRAIGYSFNNIGNIHFHLSRYDSALVYYLKAKKIFEETHNVHGLSYSLGNIGELYEKQKMYDKALESLYSATEILKEIGEKKSLSEAFNHIGSIQAQLRNFSASKASLDNSLLLAQSVGANEELIYCYLAFAKLDSARGDMNSAFEWIKKHLALKESVFNNEKSKQISFLQTEFETEQKNRQIAVLQVENKLVESQKAHQKTYLVSVVTGLSLIALGLLVVIRHKQKSNQKLEAQRAYSEELNQLKDKLFSIISHDLRSPLNSLKGLLNLVCASQISEQDFRLLLSKFNQNTQQVIDLVDNLLSWARSSLNSSSINPRRFCIQKLIEKNFGLLNQQAQNKEIELGNFISDLPETFADEDMIDLVLRNLISNAIKFTNNKGNVSISGKHDQKSIIIMVQDNGIGIPSEQHGKLFGSHNFSTHGTANEKGTGLGLILCKDFIEINGGKIWADSAVEKGSTFCFSLPLAS